MKRIRYSPSRLLTSTAVLVAACSFLLSGCCSQRKYRNTPTFNAIQNQTAQFQVDTTFPLTSKQCDRSVLPTNYFSFTAYKGQAYIYFSAKNIRSCDVYINNQKIPARRICRCPFTVFDASPYIKNGKNILYIAQVKPRKEGKHSLRVQIPYPSIQKKTKRKYRTPYSKKVFKLIDRLLTAETAHGFPGAQLLVVKDGQLIKNTAYGVVSHIDNNGAILEKPKPVIANTLFDIASNTKMYATNFALQKLIAEGTIHLHDPVQLFFPDFKDTKKDRIKGKDTITVFDLLTHQSGFPAGGQYFRKIPRLKNKEEKSNRKHTFDLIMQTPLTYEPHSDIVYSDINYMLLAFIIEKVTETGLDAYVTEHFYKPLNLSRICFKPLENGFEKNEIAATEYAKNSWNSSKRNKKTLKQGHVHDPEAFFSMEEVSGHAGLFSNAESLGVLAQIMLNGGGYGIQEFFPSHITHYFTVQQTLSPTVGLGWRRQGKNYYNWAFSGLASEHTFGHTGWTGTVTLIDPEENLIIILLTNAKNTPPAKRSCRGRFQGDYYLLKEYGAITTFVYEACKNADSDKLNSMLIELAEKKYQILKEVRVFNNKGTKNSLKAIMETIRRRRFGSLKIRKFLRSGTGKAIKKLIAEKK